MERKICALRNGAMFHTCSVLEIERKIREDEAAMAHEELKEATTMRSKDWDHDLVQEEDDIHTHEGRTS